MNSFSVLLGYLAFSCLQKLVKSAQIQQVHAHAPYSTLVVKLPFELQDSLITVMKEELRGVLKKKLYKVLEMMSSVALDYADHKKMDLELVNEDPIITLLETDHALIQMEAFPEEESWNPMWGFDLFSVYTCDGLTYLTFGYGKDVKALKKQAIQAQSFDLKKFLNESGFLNEHGAIRDRGLDLLSYYRHLIESHLYSHGLQTVLSEKNILDRSIRIIQGSFRIDPWILPGFDLQEVLLTLNLSKGAKKLNSYLKSLIKILKLLSFRIQITFCGKFPESDLKELTSGLDNLNYQSSDYKQIKIEILDTFERYVTIAHFELLKKEVQGDINLLKIILMHVLVHKKLYPESLDRPKQIAVIGDLEQCPPLCEALFKAKFTGCHAFVLESKGLISDKQALDYQIDNLVYYSQSDGVLKEKAFK